MSSFEDRDVWFLMMSPLCVLVFTVVSAGFMFVDLYKKPAFIAERRIQSASTLPTAADYRRMLPVVLVQNGFLSVVVCPPLTLAWYRYVDVQPTFPGWVRVWFEVVAMALLYDSWFWACHRLFHLPSLYRFHKLHHQWKAPCALEGAYFDPVDFMIGNYFPMLVLPAFITSHFFSMLLFGCVGAVSVAVTHSGYDMRGPTWFLGPLKPSVRHDAHHEFFDVNFSTFGIQDVLFGTYLGDEGVRARRAAKRS
eukprot:TRINITY_DN38150_c0_g1_i1.p1 TRINITY_DN38150_c0_g1~~TRINITY_DN38150_c0_g1_i1.p1  ORF type:complete len:251 (-),score=35.77 TRINITY_DN38150_c0_g1_i1:104-856(-)